MEAGPRRLNAVAAEAIALAALVGLVLVVGGEVVRASYHGYLHTTIGGAVVDGGWAPENPYHAGDALRYYTLYPWLSSFLGSFLGGPIAAFAWLSVVGAAGFAWGLDALGRAAGLSWGARRLAFVLAVFAFNGLGWLGWLISPPADTAVPVFAFESMTFAAQPWGWDARLQAFLPKFLNVSSFGLALGPALWALARGLEAVQDPHPRRAWRIAWPAAIALAINPLAGGFVGLCLAGWGLPRLVRGETAERIAWVVAGLVAAAMATPFLLPAFQAAGDGPSLTGSVRFQHDGPMNVLGPCLLLLPGAGWWLATRRSADSVRWAYVLLLALGVATMASLPWGNEYKMARLFGILAAIPAAQALSTWWGWLRASVLVVVLTVPTTILVVMSYLDWGASAPTPALQSGPDGRMVVRPDLAARALPPSVAEALHGFERGPLLWMNLVHPGTQAARGLVQGNVLAPALRRSLFVDQPQIHNDRLPDLVQRLSWTVGSDNLSRVFGEARGQVMRQALQGESLPGLWSAVSQEEASAGLQAARAHLPNRAFLILTQSDYPHVVDTLHAAGGECLADEGGISLWHLPALRAR